MDLNAASVPLTAEQQTALLQQVERHDLDKKKMERKIRRLEQDCEAIRAMCESAMRSRDSGTREQERQDLYNHLMLDAMPSILMVLDTEFKYVTGTGKLISRHFDLSDAMELPALPLTSIFSGVVSDEWIEKTLSNCKHALETVGIVHYNDSIDYLDQREMHVNVTISPAVDEDSNVLGVVFLMHDITELVMLKDEAEAASLAKSNFLANMSHEIRTPMNAVLGMANLLSATSLDDVQKSYVTNMLKASDSLLNIINDILDFTKIDAEKFEITNREYRLIELISDVTNIINLRAGERNLGFNVDIDPALPARLSGDDLHIKQILVNILSNAVKYTKTGEVTLQVSPLEQTEDGLVLRFAVIDTGIGIRPDEMETLFTAFNQVGLRKNQGIKGTGLGLAVSKGMAGAMGGDITVESEYGKGSVFSLQVPQKVIGEEKIISIRDPGHTRVLIFGNSHSSDSLEQILGKLFLPHTYLREPDGFLECLERESYTHLIYWCDLAGEMIGRHSQRLDGIHLIAVKELSVSNHHDTVEGTAILYEPLLITEVARLLNQRNSTSKKHLKSEPSNLGSFKTAGVKALLVDDNEINLIVASEMLKFYDIDVAVAGSGPEAIALAEGETFDLIFMDHMMPEMDGIEATRRIRELGGWNGKVPIIALTANAVVGNKEYFLENQLDDYMSKPIEINFLNQVLRRWLPEEKLVAERADEPVVQAVPDRPLPEQLARVDAACPIEVYGTLEAIGGSEETYITILKAFLGNLPKKIERMENMVSRAAWQEFRIEIHAQKSALFNIGARALSEKARKLELAATALNHAYIHENFRSFLQEMTELKDRLSEIFPQHSAGGRPPATALQKAALQGVARRVISLIDVLEHDIALEEMERLSGVAYGQEADVRIAEAKAAVENFDYDTATAVLQFFASGESGGDSPS